MSTVLYDDGHHRCVAFHDLVRGDDGVQANQFLIVDNSALTQQADAAWAEALRTQRVSTDAAANARIRRVGDRIGRARLIFNEAHFPDHQTGAQVTGQIAALPTAPPHRWHGPRRRCLVRGHARCSAAPHTRLCSTAITAAASALARR